MSEQDERLWAALAHASIWLNFVTGFLGVFAPLVIYLVYKDRSRYLAFQSMQAFIFQLVFWVGGGILATGFWVITGIGSAFLVGLICIPIAGLFSLIPLGGAVYGIVAAVKTYNGEDFRYWLIADWVKV
jgi:uncharacterized Tic20 family protein